MARLVGRWGAHATTLRVWTRVPGAERDYSHGRRRPDLHTCRGDSRFPLAGDSAALFFGSRYGIHRVAGVARGAAGDWRSGSGKANGLSVAALAVVVADEQTDRKSVV